MKKIRIVAPLAMAAAAAAIGFAPIAAAAPAAATESVGSTVVQSPGNAQVTATPGAAALQAGQQQYPFFGYGYGGLLFHHGGHR
jgi:hypothetical protein